MKKKCVIYANCQGRAIQKFLELSEDFSDRYDVINLENYVLMKKGVEFPYEKLNDADLIIFQPLGKKHKAYSTDLILAKLSEKCKMVSFPYIFNDGLWPLIDNGDSITGGEIISRLYFSRHNFYHIVLKFIKQDIDFELDLRFRKSLNVLKEKESTCDIKITEFISDNVQNQKLFLTHNHHTTVVYLYCANKILQKLGLKKVDENMNFTENYINLPDCWPQSPYETETFKLNYSTIDHGLHQNLKESNWIRHYLKIIFKIYKLHTQSPAKIFLAKVFVKIIIIYSHYSKLGYLTKN